MILAAIMFKGQIIGRFIVIFNDCLMIIIVAIENNIMKLIKNYLGKPTGYSIMRYLDLKAVQFLALKVDRHPQFNRSRCLFVVRTDGGWIDFSYQKCLRAYIQDEYPSYGERFIKEHIKRSSG